MLHRAILRKSITFAYVHLRGNKSKPGLEAWVIKLVKLLHCTATEPTSSVAHNDFTWSLAPAQIHRGLEINSSCDDIIRTLIAGYVCYITVTGGSSLNSAVMVFDLYVAASERSHLYAVYISAVQMGNQARRQDLAAGGVRTQKGGPHFWNTVLDVCSNQWAKRDMGGHRFQMGGPGTTGPPLATVLWGTLQFLIVVWNSLQQP